MQSDRVSKWYNGALGKHYSRWQTATGGMAQENARRFQPFVKGTDSVLDFGCGGGAILAALECGDRFGVEPNPASRHVCKTNGVKAFASVDDVPADSIDVVISNHALEHCLNPLADLRSLRRPLKDRGVLVFVIPMEDWRRQKKWVPIDDNHHLFGWTPLTIGNLFTEAGYEVDAVDIVRLAWPPGFQVLWNRLPMPAFDVISRIWSIVARMPQLRIQARPRATT